MKSYIWITTQFEGLHRYKDAPEEVAFLRNTHRHLFKVKIWIEVFHSDRDIEFIMFKRFVEGIYHQSILYGKSCEMVSDDYADCIMGEYPGRNLMVEVSEDGENGSYKEYLSDKDNSVSNY